jgi:hypothetical protein
VVMVLMIYCCRWYYYYYCGWCLISDLWSLYLSLAVSCSSSSLIFEATFNIINDKKKVQELLE